MYLVITIVNHIDRLILLHRLVLMLEGQIIASYLQTDSISLKVVKFHNYQRTLLCGLCCCKAAIVCY